MGRKLYFEQPEEYGIVTLENSREVSLPEMSQFPGIGERQATFLLRVPAKDNYAFGGEWVKQGATPIRSQFGLGFDSRHLHQSQLGHFSDKDGNLGMAKNHTSNPWSLLARDLTPKN